MNTDHHIPVLLDEVLQYLAPKKGETLLDATAGYGGHASAILERTLQMKGSVLTDRDEQAIRSLQMSFADEPLEIIHEDFAKAAQNLVGQARQFDLILADIGLS